MVALRRACVAVATAGIAAAAIAMACGPGDLSDLTRGRPDAGIGTVDAAPDTSVCIHASAPERPAIDDGPDTPMVVFGVQNMRFDTSDPDGGPIKPPQSLDLDQTCTCLEPDSCIPPDSGEARPCDGPDGRDNVAGVLLTNAAVLAPGIGVDVIRKQISLGLFETLVSLQGWNGLDDDPAVVVGVLLSSGSEGSQGDAGRDIPKFDGTDVWTVVPGSLLGGSDIVGRDCRVGLPCLPSNFDGKAHVRGGVLVAHLDIPLPIITAAGVFQIDFTGATLTGKISKEGGVLHLDGEIAGRWAIDRLLPSFARLRNPLTGTALCLNDAGLEVYGILKKSACDGVDLTATPSRDRTNARCDALSNAVSFTAVKASVGTVWLGTKAIPNDCPEFFDKCN